ncbi:TPM domain-containing protein [Kineococcus rhizosphaerae]|uniref:TLP18.3/Psb32/MOLO-1 phosphatase superfamily protein n=1 Tax=Kineococcus rhizosphaerae TaxID=559628 RepID=A0A2T0RBM6_9ACTN|nr:TPM domain-containing protein [Kineococcus rhizosphaerae]PRY18540.1 TLP18.3/Psb32/MOLO-1 phosphatase superfamily protein [Kineococcus rhizosphaerae]
MQRLARLLLAGALATGSLLTTAGAADAVEPFRLGGQVTDRVGALDGHEQEVTAALDGLRTDTGVQLWVVYVDTFDGQDGRAWADATAQASGLGQDDVLLAVATQDRAYGYSVDDGFRLDAGQVDEVARDTETELASDDWPGAVVAGARSIEDELTPSHTIWWVVGALAVLGGLVIVAVSLVHRHRTRPEAVGPTPEFAGRPTAELRTLADTLLVQADDAVRSAGQELEFAVAEFGPDRTGGFATVLGRAREALQQAFAARQSLDDEVPETETDRRRVLAEVIEACRTTGTTLDEAAHAVDELRDLVRRAPGVLDGIEARLLGLRAGVEPSRALLSRLRTEFGETAVASVADAVGQARDRIGTAETSCAAARSALGDPTRSGEVVDAVRTAEAAAAQAEQLLAGVSRTEADLRRAVVEVPVATARLRAAASAGVAGSEAVPAGGFAAAAAAAQAVADQAGTTAGTDPLGTLHRLVEAERVLDAARDRAEEAVEARRSARAALDQALVAARAEVAAADDFIGARRGAVGSSARTHLGEARRHLEQAVALAGQDPAAALEHARQADALAERASASARADVSSWQTQQTSRTGSGDDLGAVLGGILWGAGTSSSRRRSGWSGGGFGGGFGGSTHRSSPRPSSSRRSSGGGGRRGSGGRF